MIETKFKKTDIGEIPEDWDIKALGDIGEPKMCKRIMKSQTKEFGDIPFYKIGTFGNIPNAFISKELFEDYKNKFSFPRKGEILISAAGTIGRAIIYNGEDSYYQDSNIVWIDNNESFVLNSFLFNIYKIVEWDTNTGTISRLYNDNLKRTLIQFPPIAEQQRIATVLSDIDALLSILSKKIEKKKLIKQGVMQRLLTGKKRLAGFTEPWREKRLGELCQLFGRIGFRGYTKADLVRKGEGAITFSPSDIHDNQLDYTNCTYISMFKYEESPEIKVYSGDIIFCKTASIGKCAIVKELNEKATINPQFVVMKNFVCSNVFLYYKLVEREFQERVKEITGGSTIPTMSQEKLKEQVLLMPTLSEQTVIAAILSDMDKEIEILEAKRTKYEQVKQGMMQQLLTGKIRLID